MRVSRRKLSRLGVVSGKVMASGAKKIAFSVFAQAKGAPTSSSNNGESVTRKLEQDQERGFMVAAVRLWAVDMGQQRLAGLTEKHSLAPQ